MDFLLSLEKSSKREKYCEMMMYIEKESMLVVSLLSEIFENRMRDNLVNSWAICWINLKHCSDKLDHHRIDILSFCHEIPGSAFVNFYERKKLFSHKRFVLFLELA